MNPRTCRVLPTAILLALLAGCRTDNATDCPSVRVFRDSAGAALEKERIGVQWVMVRGSLDSLLATREGAAAWERAARSLETDAAAYRDSLRRTDSAVRFGDGCVDWNRTWFESGFDRAAMASALVRVLVDTGVAVLEFEADTAARPRFLDIRIQGSDQAQRPVRIAFDSIEARVAR